MKTPDDSRAYARDLRAAKPTITAKPEPRPDAPDLAWANYRVTTPEQAAELREARRQSESVQARLLRIRAARVAAKHTREWGAHYLLHEQAYKKFEEQGMPEYGYCGEVNQ